MRTFVEAATQKACSALLGQSSDVSIYDGQ